MSDSVTEHWKRPRLENCSKSCAGNTCLKARFVESSLDEEDHFLKASKKRAISATTMPDESNTNRGIPDELAEPLGNVHEGARALADRLQTRSITRIKDQSMIEAAKCIFPKLFGEASDDMERVTPQSRKSLHIETTRDSHRCFRPETVSEKSCSRSETLVEKSCSHSETPSFAVKLEPASKTQPSRESLEQVVDDDLH